MTDKPYYTAYENRYRAAYSQGITYWESDPRELACIHADVTAFLTDLPTPASTSPSPRWQRETPD